MHPQRRRSLQSIALREEEPSPYVERQRQVIQAPILKRVAQVKEEKAMAREEQLQVLLIQHYYDSITNETFLPPPLINDEATPYA